MTLEGESCQVNEQWKCNRQGKDCIIGGRHDAHVPYPLVRYYDDVCEIVLRSLGVMTLMNSFEPVS